MGKIIQKHYVVVFFLIITINFFLPRLMPGDPFFFFSVTDGVTDTAYSEEQIAQYKEYYGLDEPLGRQYLNYLMGLGRGYLGYSIYYNRDVTNLILARVPWTLLIVLLSLIFSSLLGTILGSISAWFRKNTTDSFLYFFMVVLSEIPAFLLGVFFLFIFAAKLRWFPLSGGVTPFGKFPTTAAYIRDILHHAALPILTLSITRIGEFYLLSRNSMMNVLTKSYITTAQAKGLKNRRIIFRHALKNAIPPVIARVFMSLGMLFGGAVLIENVFNYPGIGKLMREAVLVRDYVLLQGIFLFITILILLMNFLADLIYRKIDPRVSSR